MRASLAPDHVLFDSHGYFTSGEIFEQGKDRLNRTIRVRIEAPGATPSVLTILVLDNE